MPQLLKCFTVVRNMKYIITILLLLFIKLSFGQVPKKEEWRYVDMYTSLQTDTTFEKLIPSQLSLTDSIHKKLKLTIVTIEKSKIIGHIINATVDTVKILQNGAVPVDFYTEVTINGKWVLFQTAIPQICGMSLGTARLYPNSQCDFELKESTHGNLRLPFRLTVKTVDRLLHSNIITITCTKQQFNMTPSAIRPYTL